MKTMERAANPNKVFMAKTDSTEIIRVVNKQKNLKFELTVDTATKQITHYRSEPLDVGENDNVSVK